MQKKKAFVDNMKIEVHVIIIHSIASSGIQTVKHNKSHSGMCLEDCISTIHS